MSYLDVEPLANALAEVVADRIVDRVVEIIEDRLRPVIAPALLSVPEAATYLNVSESFLRRLVAAGTLTATRIGDRVLLAREALDTYVRDAS